ncbi:MAG: indole-3-glycerol phosphate synthase TrpC [Gammaproteobacteria bacterium]
MSSNRLMEILARKNQEVTQLKQQVPLRQLQQEAMKTPPAKDFTAAISERLEHQPPAIIAEIKFASPSAGTICEASEQLAASTALGYQNAGATCLSVLTDKEFFNGSIEYLRAARQACDLPILCKDFMLDPWQVWQARQAGADAILLIAAALSDQQCIELADEAHKAQMSIVIEIHKEAELKRVLRQDYLAGALIGINNRDLTSFKTSLQTSELLLPAVPSHQMAITESGIKTPQDIERLHHAGASAFLIGESLMRTASPEAALRQLLESVNL